MNDPAAAHRLPWLSVTAAGRLLSCPASVALRSVAPPPAHPAQPGQDAGTLAHLAVQQWVHARGWLASGTEQDTKLTACFHAAATAAGVQPNQVPEGTLTAARLRRRAPELAALLRRCCGDDADVSAEVDLADPATRLRGRIDLLVRSAAGLAVIDLKTGVDAAGSTLPAHIETQMLAYAYLAREAYGALPALLAIFSLRDGTRLIAATETQIDTLVGRLLEALAAWEAGQREARPHPASCRFCPRRLTCDAHWQAMPTWDQRDGVEGTVLRSYAAANGRGSIYLQTADGPAWLTEIAAGRLPPYADRPGSRIRAVRVQRSSPEDDRGAGTQWRATAGTVIAVASG